MEKDNQFNNDEEKDDLVNSDEEKDDQVNNDAEKDDLVNSGEEKEDQVNKDEEIVGQVGIVKLNVRGEIMMAEIQDLKIETDSVLAKMFESVSRFASSSEVERATWINANPTIFSVILDWLKFKDLFIPTNITLRSVMAVADYFCLDQMMNALRQREEEEDRLERERENTVDRNVDRIIEAIRQNQPNPYPVFPYAPNPPPPGPGPFPGPPPPGPGPFPGPPPPGPGPSWFDRA